MPRPALVALAALLAAGCGGPAEDYSKAVSPAEFKDAAPANAKAAASDFPGNLVDHTGKPVDLMSYRGSKNVVLVVTRGIPQSPGGVPCPYCVAQATSLSNNKAQFAARDAEVLFLFPGPADQVGDFIAASAPLKKSIPFAIALDRDLAVCDKLGIRGDWAKPSTYVLDKKGAVAYGYVGETRNDRPSVKAVLAELDRLQGGPPKPAAVPPTAAR